jgi:hypothetical protein
MCVDTLYKGENDDDDDDDDDKLQLGYHPVAVVILHVHKYEISN